MKYNEMTWGQMEAVINKLGGYDAVMKFLRGEFVVKMIERSFAIWKAIILGFHQSPSAYCKALKANGCRIGEYADQILDKIRVSETEVQLDLVVKTVAELGFKDGACRDAIYARAIELGLELCPAEVGPALRLAYLDQPYGEWLRIAMEPIADSDGNLKVFEVDHVHDERWLGSCSGDPVDFWRADLQWVFVAP